jgi:hypothetical protein
MRSATTAEAAVLTSAFYRVTTKVEVKNGSGTWKDYTEWVDVIRIEEDIDQPTAQLTLELVRDDDRPGGGIGSKRSLAPLRSDSVLNRNDAGAYSSAIDVAREIRVSTATTEVWRAPVSGDFKPIFEGAIDRVAWHESPVRVEARDKGGLLADTWIEDRSPKGSFAGTAIETVMGEILNGWTDPDVPLYTPTSPSFNISPVYMQEIMPVLDALRNLAAGKIGWDVRYKWDSGTSSFRLTFYQPDRTKTTPDATIPPSRVLAITNLNIDRSLVRNAAAGYHKNNPNTGVHRSDVTSIAKYGRRWMKLVEADDSAIDTDTEMETLLDRMIADLKDPKAEQDIEMHFDWRVELSDLLRFSANGRWYDSDQDLAVTSFAHELSRERQRTRVQVRGKPAGQHELWISYAAGLSRRVTRAFSERARVEQRYGSHQIAVGSKNSVQSMVVPLSASDAGATATITVASHDIWIGYGWVTFTGGSITGLAFNTDYYVYADDPGFLGGTVTWIVTVDPTVVAKSNGRYYAGKIRTPTDGGGGTTGGGGGGGGANGQQLF